jgi:hypothetical protein
MFRSAQYGEPSHCRSRFVPLLALQELQHMATLIGIMDTSSHLSLSKCSHVGLRLRSTFDEEKLMRQYTQDRSLARTFFCNDSGIPQFFMMPLLLYQSSCPRCAPLSVTLTRRLRSEGMRAERASRTAFSSRWLDAALTQRNESPQARRCYRPERATCQSVP